MLIALTLRAKSTVAQREEEEEEEREHFMAFFYGILIPGNHFYLILGLMTIKNKVTKKFLL